MKVEDAGVSEVDASEVPACALSTGICLLLGLISLPQQRSVCTVHPRLDLCFILTSQALSMALAGRCPTGLLSHRMVPLNVAGNVPILIDLDM